MHVPDDTARSRRRGRASRRPACTPNPIGENLIKFYPTDPTGNLNVNAPNISNMNTFSVKVDHQLNSSNLINERVFWGSNFQSAPAGNSGEIIPPNGPIDMFNSVTDPTIAALVGVVWNSTISNHTLLETRFGFNLLLPDDRAEQQDRSEGSSASTPVRSTPKTSACRA